MQIQQQHARVAIAAKGQRFFCKARVTHRETHAFEMLPQQIGERAVIFHDEDVRRGRPPVAGGRGT